MPNATQFETEAPSAAAQPGERAIREQLKKLLAHPLFTHSKRYPVLLQHIVEQTLAGHTGELKERLIGVVAFGRQTDYDVSIDPVVRMTAAEVRKRISQYYYNPEHAGELVIELSAGSYVPSFHLPAETVRLAEHALEDAPTAAKAVANQRRFWLLAPVVLLLAFLVGFGLGRLPLPWQKSNLERFWEPIATAPGRITYCLGEPDEAIDRERHTPEEINGSLNVSDVLTLARSLAPRKGAFRVVAAPQTSFEALREAPVVLIGAFDNPWTLRITQNLPIGFELSGSIRKVVDRRQGKVWTFDGQGASTRPARDYGVVARIRDRVTGQPVILLAGILGEGTEAASEVVSNPSYLNAMLDKVPKNWDQRNLEAVIETEIIDGHPGPPTVLALESW
ncbi:hypothetical protein ACOBR2_15780 [Telmatobacter bradus]|uniref:hypothetical protein n=1 Tax=Telmatobacter bradus TaxID=474953 RepID=UPI003B433216